MRFYYAVVVVLSYSGKLNPDALPASKNEYKQTVASVESQVEADMINFGLMDGHGYLIINKLLVLIFALIIFPITYISIHYITSISYLKQK